VTEADARVERRAGSQKAILQLVEHRTEMLSLYGEMASHRPFKESTDLLTLLQRFCQALVDYTADAHFRLYRYIENNTERRANVASMANKIYPVITQSTQRILDFNDRYDTPEHCSESLSSLESDLSRLGELLADRIENEDRLIEAMRSSR